MPSTEDLSKHKCDTESEDTWIENIKSLFCSFSPIPKGSRYSGVRFNSITRLILYITVLLYYSKCKKWHYFLLGGLVFLGILYSTRPKTRLRENFAILSPASLKEVMSDDYTSLTSRFPTNTPNGKSMETPYTALARPVSQQVAQIDSIQNQRRLAPTKSANVTNTYGLQNYSDNVYNTVNEPGKRDPQASIQYWTPYVGVNRKTMMEPIIGPRITDQDYWGKQGTVRSDVNKLQIVDVTNEAINTSDMAQIPRRYPNAQPDGLGQVQYPLALPVSYEPRVPNAVWNMNPVGQDPDIGYYSSGQSLYNSQTTRDFEANVLPTFQNANSYPTYNIDNMLKNTTIPGLNTNSTPNYQPYMQGNTWMPPTQEYGVTQQMALQQMGVPAKEGFYFVDTPTAPVDPAQAPNQVAQAPAQDKTNLDVPKPYYYPPVADGQPVPPPNVVDANQPGSVPPPQLSTYYNQKPLPPLVDRFNNDGVRGVIGGDYNMMNRVPPGQNVQIPAVKDQLMYASPTYSFTDDYFKEPNTKLFLQDVQPKLYSYVVDQTPINSSVGISYAPQRPPRVMDQITYNNMATPLYSRIDPQLVRKDGTPGQQASQPERTDWSANYSNFEAPQGSINFEDIYNPTFSSYGDSSKWRSYSDVNLGSVNYYYSDVDAVRMPNFISPSNVDFIDFRNPNGQIWPEYRRTASLDDVRAHVENQTTADELFHRQDIQDLQMAKANRINYQMRFAPLRNGFHGGFGYGSSV
jgi:hypothetical protein